MGSTETRRVGKHLFIFEKGKKANASDKSRTLIASCVGTDEENLPQEFINYMRTLFGILDERRTGFVKLSDIEARWGRKNGQLGAQPLGVLENLRKVSPPNGLLSFETLCLGFRLALRPSEGEIQNLKQLTVQTPLNKSHCELAEKNEPRALDTKGDQKRREDDPVLVQRPYRRPRSMIQLRQQKELPDLSVAKRRGGILEGIGRTDKKAVIDKLREWHTHELRKGINNVAQQPERVATNSYGNTETSCCRQTVAQEGKENGSDSEHRLSQCHSSNKEFPVRIANKSAKVRVYYQGEKANGNGLNGGSRDNNATPHTVGKVLISKDAKLKSLDDELKLLGEGLCAVEEVRDWLFTRITAVQEEKLYVNSVKKYSPRNYEASVHNSRRQELGLSPSNFRNFARHIEELKFHLDRVVQKPLESLSRESSELGSKRRIAQLENEKRALIRELFQYKSQQDNTTICGSYIHTRKK